LQALNASGPLTKDLTRLEDLDLQASINYLYVPETVAPSTDPNETRASDPMGEVTSWNGRFRVVRPDASGGLGVVSVAVDDELPGALRRR
jgi:hypothetical protein